ncbi:MAG: ribosomal protein S18-alanine N-acetyltransferase [Acidobacteriota bacterium]
MSALPEPFTLRDARHVDLDAVASLERLSFPIPWKREYFEIEVGAPWRFNRVARSGGALVGYVFCAFAGGEVHVNKIAVAPDVRRQGVASALMNEVLLFAARVDAEEIFLEVRFSNQPARTFYAGLGFTEAGRRGRYYLDGEDALVMVLKLGGPRRLDDPPAMKGDSGR